MPSDLAAIIKRAPVEVSALLRTTCSMTRDEIARLAEPSDLLLVGEGIETGLPAMQVARHPARGALSTSGLRALDLPAGVRTVIVLAEARAADLVYKKAGLR